MLGKGWMGLGVPGGCSAACPVVGCRRGGFAYCPEMYGLEAGREQHHKRPHRLVFRRRSEQAWTKPPRLRFPAEKFELASAAHRMAVVALHCPTRARGQQAKVLQMDADVRSCALMKRAWCGDRMSRLRASGPRHRSIAGAHPGLGCELFGERREVHCDRNGHRQHHQELRGGGELNFICVPPRKWDQDNGNVTDAAMCIAALGNDIGVLGGAPHASSSAARMRDASRRG